MNVDPLSRSGKYHSRFGAGFDLYSEDVALREARASEGGAGTDPELRAYGKVAGNELFTFGAYLAHECSLPVA